jgi:hypothetical protein
MPTLPCAVRSSCECDESPLANLSAEAPDLPTYFSIGFQAPGAPLGAAWLRAGCLFICESTVSQEAADLCAARQGYLCVTGGWSTGAGSMTPDGPVPPAQITQGANPWPAFTNTEQTCSVRCPDGLAFFFTVPAGVFAGKNQSMADMSARTYACRQAQLRQVCLGTLAKQACPNLPYTGTITASGKYLATGTQTNLWELVAGTLPPGLTFHGGHLAAGQVTISGTPTTIGSYFFVVQVTDPKGDSMAKGYTINVAGITGTLPDGTPGAPYSTELETVGFSSPAFGLESGSLPSGLTLHANGIVDGTPINAETDSFDVRITDGVTGFNCVQKVSLTVAGGCSAMPGLGSIISADPQGNNQGALAFRDTDVPMMAIGVSTFQILFHAMDGSIPDAFVDLGAANGWQAEGGCFCPDTSRFYFAAGDFFSNARIYVIDASDPDVPPFVETTISMDPLFYGCVKAIFLPDSGLIVFSGHQIVVLFNPATNTVVASIDQPVIPDHDSALFVYECAFCAATNEIVIGVHAGFSGPDFFRLEAFVYFYDADTLAFHNSVALPIGADPDDSTYGGSVVYCPSNELLYCFCQRENDSPHVYVINPTTFATEADLLLTTIASNADETVLEYDPHRDLVLIGAGGTKKVAAICPFNNTVLGTTAPMAQQAFAATYSGYAEAVYFAVSFTGAQKVA